MRWVDWMALLGIGLVLYMLVQIKDPIKCPKCPEIPTTKQVARAQVSYFIIKLAPRTKMSDYARGFLASKAETINMFGGYKSAMAKMDALYTLENNFSQYKLIKVKNGVEEILDYIPPYANTALLGMGDNTLYGTE
jgi:hypothetical protein